MRISRNGIIGSWLWLFLAMWDSTCLIHAADPQVRITEILAANATGLKDEDGEEQPWIELFNDGPTTVNLDSLALSDDPEDPGQWPLPSLILEPHGRLVVFASGKDRRNPLPGRKPHTNFRLSRNGEFLGIFNGDTPRRIVFQVPGYPRQRNDVSWGESSTNEWAYFAQPSPGLTNSGVRLTQACAEVEFSVSRGYLTGPVDLILSCPTPGATLRYTTNGADPNLTNSIVYSGPIAVNRNLVVRANATREGMLPSETRTHTYLLTLTAAQRGLPAISLATATNNLVGRTGIVGMQGGTRDGSGAWVSSGANSYYNPINRGVAWERPVSVEFLTPTSNGEFQVDAGLRLHASDYFRPRLTPSSKFSWRLYFRGDYGSGRLHYPLVPVSSTEDYDALVCRAGSNDLNPFVRDEICRRLLADCGQVSARGTFATLFMNGKYSGYYNPVERVEADFLAAQHGGGEAWDIMSQSGVLDGDRISFDDLLSKTRAGTASTDSWYQGMMGRLDVTNYVDYLLVNAYGYTGDWPHNNWRAARERRAGALWRYYIWDAEWSMGWSGRSVSGNTFTELGTTEIGTLYARLKLNPEFRLLFADRAHRHLFNGGALTTTNINRHFAETTVGLSALISGLDRSITNTWTKSRPAIFVKQLINEGLFASSNAPVFRQHGGLVPKDFALSMTHQSGQVWYTLDGTDPRVAFTGAIAKTAQLLDPATPPLLHEPTLVKARSLQGVVWSALTEASFAVGDPRPPVRIGEIHYQPDGGPAHEFLELHNTGALPVDLSGFTLEGIQFRFPIHSILPAHGIWVIASDRNPASFASWYPGVVVAFRFSGSLDNGGEWIALRAANGALVDRVRYRSDRGWPKTPAGWGYSLERVRFDLDSNDPNAWQPSVRAGGSPGRTSDLPATPPTVTLSEVLAWNAGGLTRGTGTPDFVELHNEGSTEVDISGWTLSRADQTNQFRIPDATVLAAGQRWVVWFGAAALGDAVADFRLSSSGGCIVLADLNGICVKSFSYGPQAPDYSVGWLDGALRLLVPTPGAPNLAASTAPLKGVVLNEWLASSTSDDDFIELYNRSSLPVFLSPLWISVSNSIHFLKAPSAIGPGGHAVFRANQASAPQDLPFKIPSSGTVIRIGSETDGVLDEVRHSLIREGVSWGRLPDGSSNIAPLESGPSPGDSNPGILQRGLQVSEIFAAPAITGIDAELKHDWLECVVTSDTPVDLSGWLLRRTGVQGHEWSFPEGRKLAFGERIRISCDSTLPKSTTYQEPLNTGFDLPDAGATLELVTPDGRLWQRVNYGPQIPGVSIGITPSADTWCLLDHPTPGKPNATPALLAEASSLRINEWSTGNVEADDFVELYNPADGIVDLSQWRLTDDPTYAGINRYVFPSLSFMGPRSWLLIHPDGNVDQGPDHASFRIASRGELLRLYTASSNLVDSVVVEFGQERGSFGRYPDGQNALVTLSSSTPGRANLLDGDRDEDGMSDAWELENGFAPGNPLDALADADGDGVSNRDEFLSGTHPRDAASVLKLALDSAGDSPRLHFVAEPGRSYSIQSQTGLDQPWIPLLQVPAGTEQRLVPLPVPSPMDSYPQFFRVITPSQP